MVDAFDYGSSNKKGEKRNSVEVEYMLLARRQDPLIPLF
jgi:hypothetical protein